MSSIKNPHDAFFKKMMGQINIAKMILRTILPAKILRFIDLETLQEVNTNFVSEELKEVFSDVIYIVKLKNGKNAFITFLLEHKSFPDIFSSVQILYYLATGYYKQYKENRKLQIIIPIIFYHGKQKWEFVSLEDIFKEVPEELKKYIPSFDTLFVDLANFSDEQLEALENSLIAAVLLLQKYALKPEELAKKLHLILSKINSVKGEGNFIKEIIVYSLQLLDEEKVEHSIKELPVSLKNKVMTAYESLIKKGIKIGEKKGLGKGIKIGKYSTKIETIIIGYKNGVPVNILALQTKFTEKEVRDIIDKYNRGELDIDV